MLFALFEFEDKSIKVGSVEWIKDKDDSNGGVKSNFNFVSLINKTVTVCWPNTSTASGSASGAGGRKNSAASTEHRAVVLAVNGKPVITA